MSNALDRLQSTMCLVDREIFFSRWVRPKRISWSPLSQLTALGVVLALAICESASACEFLTGDTIGKPIMTFVHSHKISYVDEGLVSAQDVLIIWEKTNESLCFQFETTHTNAHVCWLAGTAKRTASGLYEYSDNSCIVHLRPDRAQVHVDIDDPSQPGRRFCNPVDTDDYVCGSNTGIGSAVYRAKQSR